MERDVSSLLSVIKEETKLWADAGAKELRRILPTVYFFRVSSISFGACPALLRESSVFLVLFLVY
jgi:hypothetical protein